MTVAVDLILAFAWVASIAIIVWALATRRRRGLSRLHEINSADVAAARRRSLH